MQLAGGATGRVGRPRFGESGSHWRGCDSAATEHAAIVGTHGVRTIVLATGSLRTRESLVSQAAQLRPYIDGFGVLLAALRDLLTYCTRATQ
jgi:hypothetical protein